MGESMIRQREIDAYQLGQLLCVLLEHTSPKPKTQRRILQAFKDYCFEVNIEAAQWRAAGNKGSMADFIVSGQCPRFRLPSLKEGVKTDYRDLARAVHVYDLMLSALKDHTKTIKWYQQRGQGRTLEDRKKDIERALWRTFGYIDAPQFSRFLENWKKLPREDIALEAVAHFYHISPNTLARRISVVRKEYPFGPAVGSLDPVHDLLGFLGLLSVPCLKRQQTALDPARLARSKVPNPVISRSGHVTLDDLFPVLPDNLLP